MKEKGIYIHYSNIKKFHNSLCNCVVSTATDSLPAVYKLQVYRPGVLGVPGILHCIQLPVNHQQMCCNTRLSKPIRTEWISAVCVFSLEMKKCICNTSAVCVCVVFTPIQNTLTHTHTASVSKPLNLTWRNRQNCQTQRGMCWVERGSSFMWTTQVMLCLSGRHMNTASVIVLHSWGF